MMTARGDGGACEAVEGSVYYSYASGMKLTSSLAQLGGCNDLSRSIERGDQRLCMDDMMEVIEAESRCGGGSSCCGCSSGVMNAVWRRWGSRARFVVAIRLRVRRHLLIAQSDSTVGESIAGILAL